MKKILLFLFTINIFFINSVLFSADDSLKSAFQFENALVKVAEKAFPSVVVVKTKASAEETPVIFEDLFGFYPHRKQPKESIPLGQGSGFIVRDNGYILTANHVIENSSEITVTLYDGREVPAKITGRDKLTDLAVLKIDVPEKLSVLKFADSDKVKVGHLAIAVGTPFTLDYSVTVGIVCQKGRVAGLNMYESYIQTDALINPGNSGGPLLTLNGEVMGVNDFIIAGTGLTVVNSGLGFAIPSNLASNIADQLIKNNEVIRPWLGITMQQLNQKMKEQFKVKAGVLVREVYSGHPAAEGGMEPGDIVISIGKTSVATPQEIQMAVLKYSPGEKIPFTVMRDGSKKELNITSGNQKNFLSSETGRVSAKPKHSAKLSSVFTEYGIKLAEKNGAVIVAEVIKGSAAYFGNIQEGMKVSGVNKMKINCIVEAESAAASNPDSILLYLEDSYSRYFIVLSR